jgi:methionyl-tRNA formyltransferase
MYDDIRYRLGLGGTPRSVGTLASEHGVETRHVKEINSHSYLEYVRELQPDVIASVAATQRFEPELLNISAKATINVHSSLLPEYRGVSPSFWTLLNDENQTGVTAHLMNETIDTGDVIVQRPIDIETNETLHSLNKKVAEVGADVLLDALEAVRTGTIDTTPIDPDEGSYYSLPEREDVRLFQRKGNKFY